jgi:hypothetical protein
VPRGQPPERLPTAHARENCSKPPTAPARWSAGVCRAHRRCAACCPLSQVQWRWFLAREDAFARRQHQARYACGGRCRTPQPVPSASKVDLPL